MQPQSPGLPRVYSDSPSFRSRIYVQLFSWFGLLIAVLHLFESRSLGLFELILSCIGIYASWQHVTTRKFYIHLYALGCLISALFDLIYFFMLLSATSPALHKFLVGLVVSNTFPNLSASLDSLLQALAEDVHFFAMFSAVTSVLFGFMAAYWACTLQKDVVAASANSDIHVPLLRQPKPPPRSGISGFGPLSRQTQATQTSPRTVNPFTGRGHRLGAADT